MWRLAAVLLVIGGCGGKDETTSPTFGDDDDDHGDDSAHTGGPPGEDRKLAAEVRFRAYVAYDADLGQVVDPIIDGNDGYISAYQISLYEAGWSDADDDSFCDVRILLAGTPLATGVPQEGFLWGIDIPEGLDGKTWFGDCLDKGFDAEQFGGDPTEAWAAFDWHLRFGGQRSAELEDWLDGDTPTGDFDITWYAAGGWWTDSAGLETEDDSNYWYAYAMDADHNADLDTHLNDFMMTDINGQPITAYYLFDQRVFWTLEPPEE